MSKTAMILLILLAAWSEIVCPARADCTAWTKKHGYYPTKENFSFELVMPASRIQEILLKEKHDVHLTGDVPEYIYGKWVASGDDFKGQYGAAFFFKDALGVPKLVYYWTNEYGSNWMVLGGNFKDMGNGVARFTSDSGRLRIDFTNRDGDSPSGYSTNAYNQHLRYTMLQN